MMYENVASPSLTCPNQGNNQKIIILYIGRCSIILLILEMPGSVANRPLWQIGHCDSLGVNGSGCTVTTDRILLNESDAVMFHFHCFDFKDMPPSAWRRSHQHFILFEQESPVHTAYYTGLKLPLLTNYFNRTMTYRRRDSDISYLNTHGRLRCTKASPSSCLDFPHNTIDSVTLPRLDPLVPLIGFNITSKNRTVAWFVSKCHATHSGGGSHREYLVQNLSSFIPVDIYGGCATKEENKCSTPLECQWVTQQILSILFEF